jgi:tetratricopeptide (TPR) repeat protein
VRKILLLLVLAFFALNSSARAQSGDLLFGQANQAYAAGNYEEALTNYQAILDEGLVSGEVYFNMGNACFKLDRIGEAILYYEKAARILGSDDALKENLQIARLRIVDKIEPVPQLFLEEWWDAAVSFLSVNTFGWLTLGLAIFSALLWGGFLLSGMRFFRSGGLVITGLFVIIALLFSTAAYRAESRVDGIILGDKVAVVSEPSLNGKEIFVIHEGTRVRINRGVDGWSEITLEDGKTGWCRTNEIGTI